MVKRVLANGSFDPPTLGLWAQCASSAPIRSLTWIPQKYILYFDVVIRSVTVTELQAVPTRKRKKTFLTEPRMGYSSNNSEKNTRMTTISYLVESARNVVR